MKTRYMLTTLLVLATASASTYAAEVGTSDAQTKAQEDATFAGACSDYYNTYYSSDKQAVNSQKIASSTDTMDMADPRNFYMW